MPNYKSSLWDQLVKYDWNTPVTLVNNHHANFSTFVYHSAIAALLFGLLHVLLMNYVFKGLALKYLPEKSKKNPRSVEKFQSAAWKFVAYSFLVYVGVSCLWGEDWIHDNQKFMANWKNHNLTNSLYIYYVLEFAYYLFGTVMHLFFEIRLKDFYMMLTHHIVTLSLVGVSFASGYFRVGSMVMLLHDIADPWMEIAKINFYCQNELSANFFFVIFSSVFIYSRNYIYPFKIIIKTFEVVVQSRAKYPYGVECVAFLSILQVLHIIWSSMIVKMVMEAITGGGVQGDTREDKDD